MFSLRCKGKLLFIDKPLVMGILNLTEDSFYEGSRVQHPDEIRMRAHRHLSEGADILDLGAQSTRPGSRRLTAEEELKKLIPALELIRGDFPEALISVDTYHSQVAEACAKHGAALINDISGGEMDKNMIPAVAALQLPYICMHMKGTPETMQQEASYDNVTKTVLDFFIRKTDECLRAGITDIILDPGFGFGKTHAHNFELLKNLNLFSMLERPLMAGISRKSTIYKTLRIPAEEALNGTTVLNTIALLNGASLLRVHDVKEAREAITLYEAYRAA